MSGVRTGKLPDDEIDKILNAALDRLHVQLTSPSKVQVGASVTAKIVGASAEIDVSDLLDGVLNIDWLAFTSATLGDVSSTANSLETLTGVVGSTLAGASSAPATGSIKAAPTGILGQVLGSVSIPRLRVRAEIGWQLTDAQGNRLIEGEDFVAPNGLGLPEVLLHIPPIFQPLDSFDPHDSHPIARPVACTFRLSAYVTLSVTDRQVSRRLRPLALVKSPLPGAAPRPLAHARDLVPSGNAFGIPLLVMPLLVPTLLALFSNEGFNPVDPQPGRMLIVVPHGSPITSLEQLNGLLRKIDQEVSNLRQLPYVAASLLGIDLLGNALSSQPAARIVSATPVDEGVEFPQGVRNFQDIVYYSQPSRIWWIRIGDENVTFNDVAQSAILIGMPGTRVVFFNDADYVADSGAWAISIADLGLEAVTSPDPSTYRPLNILPFVIVRDFGLSAPDSTAFTRANPNYEYALPDTLPPNRAEKVTANGFLGQNMSSVAFDQLGTPPTCEPPQSEAPIE
ncbi:hypothetical protein [Burkholderia ubonensis]|uniref:hypothetical protein n=1 Tax=Burkholderia ubonensis TaxID=101571 RepID=UPI000A71C0BD|nr:hypothetical protein [Burkholderia ubonensis]